MSIVVVGTIRSNSTSPPTIQNTSGTEIGTFCRAWVNFNGTTNTGGFCTIRASFNVTTVADNGTGDYTVNITNALPDANYSWTVSGHRGDGAGQNGGFCLGYGTAANAYTSATTTSLRVITQGITGGSGVDWPAVCVNLFR